MSRMPSTAPEMQRAHALRMMFLEEIEGLRSAVLEARDLRTLQREINPLKQPGPNPIKKLVTAFRKAKRTRKPDDIAASKNAHHVGAMYAAHHGWPRLEKQISDHMKKIPKPLKPRKSAAKQLKRRAKVDSP